MFIGFRGDRSAWLVVPGLVVIASMLAGNLAWLTIAAEDAPDLIGTAPLPIPRIRWIKAAAAILPVLALLVPLAMWWLARDPAAAFVLLFCCLGGMASATICQLWNPRQGNRRDMKRRYRESKLTHILEMLGAFGWAGVAFCMNGSWLWMPLALVFVLLGPGSAWILGRKARRQLVLA
jgi:ABC-2 type transport system permease protein